MRFLTADLHIHTVLSPCAEAEMLPSLIVERAQELGLQMIAITDHNSAENVHATACAAHHVDLVVLAGMEVQSREEVHLLCLFDTVAQVLEWQALVYDHLPRAKNRPDVFGVQVVIDEAGNPVGYNERLLLTSTSFSVEQVVAQVSALGGISIPAHVDRPAYSMVANLGFVPPGLGISGVEISHLLGPKEARDRFPQLRPYGLIGNSDAHRLGDMARRTTLKVEAPTVAELALALSGQGDREIWIDGFQSGRVP
jgi:hypothetical protein